MRRDDELSIQRVRRRAARSNADAALTNAAELLAERGAKFTAIRRSVLRLLCLEQKAVGAYDLAAAHERESGRRTAPYTIYRALDFLQEQGLVAHLESTHTYVACAPHQGAQTSLFFVCGKCGIVTERWDPDVERTVGSAAKAIGFSTSARTIEIEGLCKECSRARK